MPGTVPRCAEHEEAGVLSPRGLGVRVEKPGEALHTMRGAGWGAERRAEEEEPGRMEGKEKDLTQNCR